MGVFEKILTLTYSQVREEYPMVKGISTARKAITMKNGEDIDSFSNDSDIIVYYDLVGDTTPLLLVERIKSTELSFEELTTKIDMVKDSMDGYIIQAVDCENPDYYDVVIVKKNIYNSIMGAN